MLQSMGSQRVGRESVTELNCNFLLVQVIHGDKKKKKSGELIHKLENLSMDELHPCASAPRNHLRRAPVSLWNTGEHENVVFFK